MDTKIMIQSTPNPNALKFVVNTKVKTDGNITYKNAQECTHNPLAKKIFELDPHVHEVYFFDNYITVTQDGSGDWDELENKIQTIVLENIGAHNPNFKAEEDTKEDLKPAASTPELERINAILDETIRPALQMDGGDLQILKYDDKTLRIYYQGACGSCPSATAGTLQAIENILKDQFDPEISVQLAEV